jgi:hypothetical protein
MQRRNLLNKGGNMRILCSVFLAVFVFVGSTKPDLEKNWLLKKIYYAGSNLRYPTFQIGDKIYTVYLKDNPYKIDVIALNGHNDCPQILTLAETYIDRSKMFDSVMKEKIEKIYNDLKWSYPVYNKNINKFFKFN